MSILEMAKELNQYIEKEHLDLLNDEDFQKLMSTLNEDWKNVVKQFGGENDGRE